MGRKGWRNKNNKQSSWKNKNSKCPECNIELKRIYIESILILNIMGREVKEQREQTNEPEEDKRKMNENKEN